CDRRRRSPRAALGADLLVELHAVPALRGVPPLLPTDPADLAEELRAVALLRGQATLAAGLGSGHLALRHPGHHLSLETSSTGRRFEPARGSRFGTDGLVPRGAAGETVPGRRRDHVGYPL